MPHECLEHQRVAGAEGRIRESIPPPGGRLVGQAARFEQRPEVFEQRPLPLNRQVDAGQFSRIGQVVGQGPAPIVDRRDRRVKMARRHKLGCWRGRGGGLRSALPLPILRAFQKLEHQLLPGERPVAQGDDVVVQAADVGLSAQDPLVAEGDKLAVGHGGAGSGTGGREQ